MKETKRKHDQHAKQKYQNTFEQAPQKKEVHIKTPQRAYLARDEEESGDVVSGEGGVEAPAHLAGHVLSDIFAQQRLNVL